MATVQSTPSAADTFAAINSANTKNSATKTSATQPPEDRFLKLLVTQLKNQDPLNPLDNAQVTSQLAQINTVSGIEKLNTTMGQMLEVYNNGQAMQAAGMIGKSVMIPGGSMSLQNGQALGGVSLAGVADAVNIDVLDATGKVIQTESLGARAAGNFGFVWDGETAAGTKAPDGRYSFRVTATQGGTSVAASGLQIGTVSAVTRAASGFQLDLGNLGTVDFKNVQEIL